MSIKVGFHGGMCCGIKHIFELRYDPNDIIQNKKETEEYSHDIGYDYHRADENFFFEAAPKETMRKRFVRILGFLDRKRPSGIVEVVLAVGPYYSQTAWVPILEENGFKEVTPEGGILNSNSGNKISVFHRYTLKGQPL